jgi:beta-phosphoglucomutase-like phosphatase (HAD superfamily)
VFEDSFHGLDAGRASGAFVVGLATTNTREAIAPRCDMVIDDFTGFTLDSIR